MTFLKKNYKIKSNVLGMLSIVLCFFIYPEVQALEPNQVELNFANVDNPWGITNEVIFDLPGETENKLYHINVNHSNNELIVWMYDNSCAIDGQNLTSINQNFYLKVYHYNSSTQKFDYHHDWTHSNKSSVEKFSMIYSNYQMMTKTKFPNWTYQYNSVKEIFDSNHIYKNHIEYFISRLNDSGYKFIITISTNGRIHPILSKNGKEFSVDYNGLRYSDTIIYLNNGKGDLNYNDNYSLGDLTKEFVDGYVAEINKSFNKLDDGTLASPFWDYPESGFHSNIILYSSFSDMFTINNYIEPIFIDNIPFLMKVPTFDKYYNYFNTTSDQGFTRTILYKDFVKTAKVYFDIPNVCDNFFEYHVTSVDKNVFYKPSFHFWNSETNLYEYGSDFQEESVYANSFREKIFNGVCIKPIITNGFLEIEVSSSLSDIILDTKSDYITKIELEYYNKTEDDPFVSEKDLEGYHCYDIKSASLIEFNLNFKIPYQKSDFLDYRLFAINQTDIFDRPYIGIYNALNLEYKKETIFDDKQKKLYTQILPGENYTFEHYNTKGFINVDTTSIKFDLRLCVNSDYIMDYNYKIREKTEADKTVGDWLEDVNKFLGNITEYIKEFFGIITYFFNKLPIIIKTAIVGLFITFVMACIIILARK